MSIEATYHYTDERDRPRMRKVRRSGKHFSMQAALWKHDRFYWKSGPGAVQRHQGEWAPRALYKLPVLLDALASGSDVFLVEGERDCSTASALWRLPATTNWQGAKAFTEGQADWFTRGQRKGGLIHIVRDNDEAGAFAAWERYTGLVAVGVKRQRLRLWVPPTGAKDLTDVALRGLGGSALLREAPGAVQELAFREGAELAARRYWSAAS